MILGEFGIESEAEEASLAAGVDGEEAGDGRGDFAIGGEDAEAAGFLCDEDVAAGEECDAPGLFEATGDGDKFKCYVELLLSDAGLAGEGGLLAGAVRGTGLDLGDQGQEEPEVMHLKAFLLQHSAGLVLLNS